MAGEEYYTVGMLIKRLSNYDPDRAVVMATDSEGNSFAPLTEADLALYVPETNWSGYTIDYTVPDEHRPSTAISALVLWPA